MQRTDTRAYPADPSAAAGPSLALAQETTEAALRLLAEQARLAALGADVATALTQPAALPDMLQGCAEAMVRHLDVAFARIWTFNKAEHVLELQASAGMYTHTNGSHSRVPVGEFKIGLIAQERQPHLTNSVADDAASATRNGPDAREWSPSPGIH